jgi:hypothetical protein
MTRGGIHVRRRYTRAAVGFSYTRIHEQGGVSHFEDVAAAAGAQGVFAPIAVESMVPCEVTQAPTPGPHTAPRRQFIVHLEGSVRVQASGGQTRVFGPGAVVLAEDLDGAGHVTTWIGAGPWRWLVLPAGE